MTIHFMTGGLAPALIEYAVRAGQFFARWVYAGWHMAAVSCPPGSDPGHGMCIAN